MDNADVIGLLARGYTREQIAAWQTAVQDNRDQADDEKKPTRARRSRS